MRKLLDKFRYHILVFLAVVGPGFITLSPIRGRVADHGGKQEAVADGWAAMRVDPTLKRNPDK